MCPSRLYEMRNFRRRMIVRFVFLDLLVRLRSATVTARSHEFVYLHLLLRNDRINSTSSN